MSLTVTTAMMDAYERDGYILVEDLATAEEVAALRQRIADYTHGERPSGALQVQVEPRVQRGEMTVEHPGDGIRKIDGLVQNDDLFRNLGTHPNIVAVIERIVGPDIKLFRNSLLLKPPRVGSQKGWHQDSPYWPIEPMELCSCWFPLDDATLENGCMVVAPGRHKSGPLPHVNVTDDFVITEGLIGDAERIAVPMRAGSGLFFHSLIPHYTAPNRSRHWRRAMALSYMSAQSHYTGDGVGPDYFLIQGRTYPDCVR